MSLVFSIYSLPLKSSYTPATSFLQGDYLFFPGASSSLPEIPHPHGSSLLHAPELIVPYPISWDIPAHKDALCPNPSSPIVF